MESDKSLDGVLDAKSPTHRGSEHDREAALAERLHRLTSHPEWRKSEERRRGITFIALGGTALFLGGAIVGALVGYWIILADHAANCFGDCVYGWSWTDVGRIAGPSSIGAFVATSIAVMASTFYWQSCRRAFLQRAQLEAEYSDLREAEDEADAKDFGSLWSVNSQRLDLYHKIATEQAEKSFRAAQLATWIGFGIVALCIIVAIFAQTTAAAVAASILGVVGGGLAAYVNSTFMRAQEISAQQLRAYFAQPLEFSRHLTAERVAAGLPAGDSRERALEAVAVQIACSPPRE